jgi:hypothetical protein
LQREHFELATLLTRKTEELLTELDKVFIETRADIAPEDMKMYLTTSDRMMDFKNHLDHLYPNDKTDRIRKKWDAYHARQNLDQTSTSQFQPASTSQPQPASTSKPQPASTSQPQPSTSGASKRQKLTVTLE